MQRLKCVVLSLFILNCATAVRSQTTVGELRGAVTDSSGSIVGDATITLQNVATNDLRKTNSDSAGDYILAQLPVGKYTLSVEKPGFQRFTLRDVVIQVDARRRKCRVACRGG